MKARQAKKLYKAQQQKPGNLQQAFDNFWEALEADPAWSQQTTCMFLGKEWVWKRDTGHIKGKLYTAVNGGNLKMLTTQDAKDKG